MIVRGDLTPGRHLKEQVELSLASSDITGAMVKARILVKLLQSNTTVSAVDIASALHELALLFEKHNEVKFADELRSSGAKSLQR